MARTVIDLDAHASVLDAAERLAEAPPDGDLTLVVAAGAPVLRSAVFLDVLRGSAGARRLSIVTTDQRARSIASSVHVPAYASLAALERQELDPTERLTPARRAAIASVRPSSAARPVATGRILGAAGSLFAATLVLLAVVLPEARVTVAPTVEAVGPVDLEVRAGGDGEITPTVLNAQISAKVEVVASGQRVVEARARGGVQLANKTTSDVSIPRGSVFSTPGGVQFLSTEERVLPRSIIVAGRLELFIGRVDVPVEAAVAGEPGNVPAGSITNGPQPDRYDVTNQAPASGGVITFIPVIQGEDYDAAVAAAPEHLQAEAGAQLGRWVEEPRADQVIEQVLVRQTALGPSRPDVVGREEERVELTVTGIATAYAVAGDDLRKAVIDKLEAEHVPVGREVDPSSPVIDVRSVAVTEEGVTWTVRARAAHMDRSEPATVSRLLAGRPAGEAEAVLDAQGLDLVSIERVPAWWPLMPLLDGRIAVIIRGGPLTQGR